MRENRLQVVSEGKEAARQTPKNGKQEGKRGDKKEDMGQEGGRAVLMPPGTLDGRFVLMLAGALRGDHLEVAFAWRFTEGGFQEWNLFQVKATDDLTKRSNYPISLPSAEVA